MTTNTPDTTKERRPRLFTMGHLPIEIRDNGYVADLVGAVKAVADEHKAQPSMIQKNGDWYIAVLIPNAAELKDIDRRTDALGGITS